jgi:hypothetical protein
MRLRTIYAGIEILAADLASQVTYCRLLVHLNGDRLFVIAEEALEGRWEGFFLFA